MLVSEPDSDVVGAPDSTDNKRRPLGYYVIPALIVGAVYGVLQQISLSVTFPFGIAAAWPPFGLAAAALVLLHRRRWPAVLLAIAVVNVPLNAINDLSGIVLPWFVAANLFEPLAAAWLLTTFAPSAARLASPRDIFTLLGAVVAVPVIGGAIAGIGISLDIGSFDSYFEVSRGWWASDALGGMIVVPLVLSVARLRRESFAYWAELATMFVVVTIATAVLTQADPSTISGLDGLPVITALLMWPSLRLGHVGASLAIFVVAAVTLIAIDDGLSVFARTGLDLSEQVAGLQLFIATLALVHLTIAAVVGDYRSAAARAEHARENASRDAALLRQSNEELSKFSYVVSHDLSAPLRALRGYSQLLIERSTGLDERSTRFVSEIEQSAERMQSMLDDLVEYSQADPDTSDVGTVDVASIVTDVVERRAAAITAIGAEVTTGPLPMVSGHRARIDRLFDNIIGNSLKFHDPERPLVIAITCVEIAHGRVMFNVTDNGIGIDPAHAESVTKMFHRLNDKTAYPGSGIGLSVCQKIVTGYGGKRVVGGELGQRATMSFDLKRVDGEWRTPVIDLQEIESSHRAASAPSGATQ